MKGSFDQIEPHIPLLFEQGARGLEEKDGEVWAYFPERVNLPLEGEWLTLPDEDWLAAWKRDLKPVQAGPFVVLAPWHRHTGPGVPIVIEPGMAFGTGHHETTRMALEALGALELRGRRVLDLGTGSGILAIAAAKLGAEAVGVDIDPTAIPQAERNARQNGVRPKFAVGSLEAAQGPFDVLVANLYAELHRDLAPRYADVLRPGGWAILTGILAEREALVADAMRRAGFTPHHRRQAQDWVLLAYRR